MLDDIDIPTMFKRSPETHLVIPEMAEGSEWAQELTNTLLTIKLDGELIRIKWDLGKQLKTIARRIQNLWFSIDGEHPADKYLWEAYSNSSIGYPLAEGYYIAFGPNINGNKMGVDRCQMVRIAPVDAAILVGWGAVSIHRGPMSTVQQFYGDIKRELSESTVEGFIIQWEQPQMVPFKFAKVTRRDFGFSWPIIEAEDKIEVINQVYPYDAMSMAD